MSRYIVFTFDDGRYDTYSNAAAILREHGWPATIFVTTGYVDGTLRDTKSFRTSSPGAATIANLLELKEEGFEIASHGDRHSNNFKDIGLCVEKLENWKLSSGKAGFSSPYSQIQSLSEEEEAAFRSLGIAYIRTASKIKGKPPFQIALWGLQGIAHSKSLYKFLNRKNIGRIGELGYLIPSITIRNTTTVPEILALAKSMEDGQVAVLTFHSISDNPAYLENTWAFSAKKFRSLCDLISADPDCEVLTLRQAVDFSDAPRPAGGNS